MELDRVHPVHHDFLVRKELIPFFEDGRKTVEVRVAHPRFARVNPGDSLTFNGDPRLTFGVSRVGQYKTFDEMLQVEDADTIFPGHDGTVEQKMKLALKQLAK